jgi:hypothetical protein
LNSKLTNTKSFINKTHPELFKGKFVDHKYDYKYELYKYCTNKENYSNYECAEQNDLCMILFDVWDLSSHDYDKITEIKLYCEDMCHRDDVFE